MRRYGLYVAVYSFAMTTALLFAQSKESPPRRAAPPTKWDQQVTDIFFPDARTVLHGPRPNYGVGGVKTTTNDRDSSTDIDPNTSSAISAPGSFAWSKLISAEVLQDEIKSHQPLLAADVKTQQVFLGGSFKNARRSFSVLAVAFAIIHEFDKDVRWKNQASAARELFARAGFNCKTATVQSFNEAKLRSQDLTSLLQGETISPPANLEPVNHWSKVANRVPLMNRLELAQQDRIAVWTANATDFKKNATAIQHEAELIAAIAEVLTREGFDDAGDPTYEGFAKSMQQAAQQIMEAAKSNNANAARAAAGALHKSCNACHADYRS